MTDDKFIDPFADYTPDECQHTDFFISVDTDGAQHVLCYGCCSEAHRGYDGKLRCNGKEIE
jgi:hypothetical protein